MQKEQCRRLAEQWELVALKQREIASDTRGEMTSRALLLAAANAWMMAAQDLRKAAGVPS